MKQIIKMNLIALTGLIALCLIQSCNRSNSHDKGQIQTYVVKKEPLEKKLFFTGTIQPLHESTITCPMDAVVEKMNFHYGQLVKKEDVIVTLNSSELQKQYNETFTEYLKAKDSFSVARAKFTGTQNLWDAGLLSKNNFLSEKSSLDTARVTLMQATKKLSEMLEKIDGNDEENLSKLSIAEFEKVRQALTSKHNLIHLRAPENGVLLYPPKSNDDKSGRIRVGASLKAGQVFALVGDLSGISVEIDVPEIDIDKIHRGMSAIVTGVALGKHALHGEVVAVNAQALAASGNALPSFTALVEVKKLSDSQQAFVKVGMSAAIELLFKDENQVLVPIAAIKEEHGASIVNVKASDGTISARHVTTGSATANMVVIESGLNEGEEVVYGE